MKEHISLGICVSQLGERISLGICVFQVGVHISPGIFVSQMGSHISLEDMFFLGEGTHNTRDMCFPDGKHISPEIRVFQVGRHISLGICVLIAWKGAFSFENILKDIFLPSNA